MNAGSLFSGAGLLDCGLAQAGIRHAWFVEREPDRRALLGQRWPGRPVHDDVRTVGAHNLERVDLIAGGFPCKGASNAGPRNGFDHPETALWAEFHRIVRELRPRYVAVENVAAIRGLHHGAVWGTVLGDLAALGYDVAWGCVRASDVGAPHGRDRIFAIARHADSVARQAPVPSGGRPGALARPGTVERTLGPDGVDSAPANPGGAGLEGRWGVLGVRPQVAAVDGDGAHVVADAGCAPGRQLARDALGAQAEDAGRRAEHDHEPRSAGSSGVSAAEVVADTAGAGAPAGELAGRLRGAQQDAAGIAVEWGAYEPAIRRWEAIHGPAPAPLTRVRRLDDGRTEMQRMRARMDRQRLSALGDGVHVHVGRLVGDALMALADSEVRHAA